MIHPSFSPCDMREPIALIAYNRYWLFSKDPDTLFLRSGIAHGEATSAIVLTAVSQKNSLHFQALLMLIVKCMPPD